MLTCDNVETFPSANHPLPSLHCPGGGDTFWMYGLDVVDLSVEQITTLLENPGWWIDLIAA